MALKDFSNMRVTRVALVGGEQDDPERGIGQGDRVQTKDGTGLTGVVIGLSLDRFKALVDWDEAFPTEESPADLTVIGSVTL